jgi:hypothetical protein
MTDNTKQQYRATTVTVVRRATPGSAPVVDNSAPSAPAPTKRAPAAPTPAKAKPVPAKPVVLAPTGELADIIAAAEEALNPKDIKDFAVLAAHFKARTNSEIQGLASTVRDLVAKARAGVSGASPELAQAAETLRQATASLADAEAKLAEHSAEVVTTAVELVGLRAKKTDLAVRDKAVRSAAGSFANLSGRAAKADGDAKTELEGQRDALKAKITTEKAAIAGEREQHGDKLANCDAEFERHTNETAGFGDIVQHVENRVRLTAEHAAAFAAHEVHAADGPGLKDRLAKAVADYKTRIAELVQAK